VPILTDFPVAPDDMWCDVNVRVHAHQTYMFLQKEWSSHCVTACANCHGDSCMNSDSTSAHTPAYGDSCADSDDQTTVDNEFAPFYFNSDDWEYEETIESCDQ